MARKKDVGGSDADIDEPKGRPRDTLTKSEFRETPAYRMKEVRDAQGLTQDEVARRLEHTRTAVAQWESGRSTPPLTTISELAKVLNTTPQYIAFGVSSEPKKVMPTPEEMGCALVPEIRFGDSPEEMIEYRKWMLPTDWLKSEMKVHSLAQLMMYQVQADSCGGKFEHGDLIIVDGSDRKPSPPGHFLVWDGIGAGIAYVSVLPQPGARKLQIRVDYGDRHFEVDADKLYVIGRVRGTWRKT